MGKGWYGYRINRRLLSMISNRSFLFYPFLLEVNLPYDPDCPSISHKFLKVSPPYASIGALDFEAWVSVRSIVC